MYSWVFQSTKLLIGFEMKLFNAARKYGAKIAAGTTVLVLSGVTMAQTTDGISAALGAVDLSGVGTKVGAAALLIVGIALMFKGPDIAKRVVRKV